MGAGAIVATGILAGGWLLGCGDSERPRLAYDLIEAFAIARVDTERVVLDVGTPGSRPYLPSGFSWSERSSDGRTFAWSEGETSTALFDVHSTAARWVVLRGQPFSDPRSGDAPEIAVRLNDQLLGTLALEPSNATHVLEAPPTSLRLGTNILELRYSLTSRPAGRQRRAIAVAWDALALLRASDPAEAKARLDASLAAPGDRDRPSPVVQRRELHLPAGSGVSWELDLGPGAELDLGVDLSGGADRRLAVWLTANGATEPVAEIETAGKVRLALPLERFGSVRLEMAALYGDREAAGPAGEAGAAPDLIVDEAKIYSVSSPSASRAGSPRAATRAPAVPRP